MLAFVLCAAVVPAATWVELTSGLPPHDDFNSLGSGRSTDELLLGTEEGFVWRSPDNGETWQIIFWPADSEPLIEPGLTNLREASIDDLARGASRDLDPRDRGAAADRAADIAGSVRDRPRVGGAPLLGSLLRESRRDRTSVGDVSYCGNKEYLYVTAQEALWRSRDHGLSWDRLNLGPVGRAGDVYWLTCDPKRRGHLVLNTGTGILESWDWGDSFAPYGNPLPLGHTAGQVQYEGDGRLTILVQNHVFREREDGNGWQLDCAVDADSVEANHVPWVWLVLDQGVWYSPSQDGIVVCERGRLSRLGDPRFARRRAHFVWVDWSRKGHLFVATDHEVYETFDSGESFELAFITPTMRTIKRIRMNPDVPGDLLVFTGGQIYRRMSDEAARARQGPAANPQATTDRLVRAAPLGEVLATALERQELLPEQVAERRTDWWVRSLLPVITARVRHADGTTASRSTVLGVPTVPPNPPNYTRDRTGRGSSDGTVWEAFATWDLANLISDPIQTGRSWRDVDLLRQTIGFRVQDSWAMWVRETVALDNTRLTVQQRAYHELARREAAAYLDEMTGGAFAAFAPDAAPR